MNASKLRPQKILSRCFSREEFEILQIQPTFIAATRKLETIKDAFNAVDLGRQLIQQSWKRVPYPFPPGTMTPPPGGPL